MYGTGVSNTCLGGQDPLQEDDHPPFQVYDCKKIKDFSVSLPCVHSVFRFYRSCSTGRSSTIPSVCLLLVPTRPESVLPCEGSLPCVHSDESDRLVSVRLQRQQTVIPLEIEILCLDMVDHDEIYRTEKMKYRIVFIVLVELDV